MNKEKLNNLIRLMYEKYNPVEYEGGVNCIMPGYYGGNDILFIGQNPGLLKEEVVGDMAYLDAYENKDYEEMEIRYIQALKSSRGTYGTFIDDIYSDNWDNISITNVFKCPFEDNVLPDSISKFIPVREQQILTKQIEYVNPTLIVAVGTIAKKAIQQMQNHDIHMKTIFMMHPSYLKRAGIYKEKVEEYKQLIISKLSNATTKLIH